MSVRVEEPYNPLDKRNLGVSVADALLSRELCSLPPEEPFIAAGVYAIYYKGDFPPYSPIAGLEGTGDEVPIYVGKAVPAGARKGDVGLNAATGDVLYRRLVEHGKSVQQAANLRVEDFFCRYLAVDDIWIPLGESLLIQRFLPVWNRVITGFGIHDPGTRRATQQRSLWDVLHPGRSWVEKLAPNPVSVGEIEGRLAAFFAGRSVPEPPAEV